MGYKEFFKQRLLEDIEISSEEEQQIEGQINIEEGTDGK